MTGSRRERRVSHPLVKIGAMKEIDRRIAALASGQRGVFARSQAIEAGLSSNDIYYRTTTGLWVPRGPHTLTFARSTGATSFNSSAGPCTSSRLKTSVRTLPTCSARSVTGSASPRSSHPTSETFGSRVTRFGSVAQGQGRVG